GGPDEGIANLRSQPPHRGILRISPTNILLTHGGFVGEIGVHITYGYLFTQFPFNSPKMLANSNLLYKGHFL
ncbi:hypothetical protein, partial [Bacillus smithii]|uniref:hypothetical protein n=1 Tax=Bacillus smithii TaxID=1479 RepID=UPI003D1BC637